MLHHVSLRRKNSDVLHPHARPVQRGSSRLRLARVGPRTVTKSVDRPTYPDKSGSRSVTTCPLLGVRPAHVS